ncbi:MAG TPA: clostripain-related cysteine peptidase, partial [Bacillota bacterium]|nr:clostripain-related cysteine peptidase [Bacillota bacterium]
ALLSSLLGGSAPQTPPGGNNAPSVPIEEIVQAMPFDLNSVLGSFSSLGSTSWLKEANTGKLNTKVDAEARDKYTAIRGGGKDEVTVMVYMCGSDLESRHGLASGDISEMLAADLSDRINLLIYTGGSSSWRNSDISAGTNRIFKVENGRLKTLSGDEGSVSLTKPSTLSGFIRYCASNYPADRYQLIFWDHGGGSLSGFGYDENFRSSGAMSLSQIDKALSDGGVKFDIVGFDACLMATAENALMLSRHADYLIASEETEAGYGWYYTPWLNALSDNSSLPSVELGKIIIDDFVDFCMQKVPGQKATLSLVDLAELEASMPAELKAFADSTLSLKGLEFRRHGGFQLGQIHQ